MPSLPGWISISLRTGTPCTMPWAGPKSSWAGNSAGLIWRPTGPALTACAGFTCAVRASTLCCSPPWWTATWRSPTPAGIFDRAMAETVLGYLLAEAKGFRASWDMQKGHVWESRRSACLENQCALVVGGRQHRTRRGGIAGGCRAPCPGRRPQCPGSRSRFRPHTRVRRTEGTGRECGLGHWRIAFHGRDQGNFRPGILLGHEARGAVRQHRPRRCPGRGGAQGGT